MEFQTIIYEVRNQIAFVTFNRPESMNAVNRQMARDLVDACKQIEDDDGIRIAIFTGAGEKAFSAGMDLKERAESGVFADRAAPAEAFGNDSHSVSRGGGNHQTDDRGDPRLLRRRRSGVRIGVRPAGGGGRRQAGTRRSEARPYSRRRRHAKTGAHRGCREGAGNLSHRRQRQRQRRRSGWAWSISPCPRAMS